MTNVAAVFGAQAETYDAARRRLIPCFDAFYGAAVAAVGLAGDPVGRVLDLGAGTGLLTGFVRAAHPDAALTLLDGAAPMLERARAALGDKRTRYVVGDLADPLPSGPWDVIVSALAIHHLDDGAKRALFARVRDGLRPGGVFVNAEQVLGSSPAWTAHHEAWHEAAARAGGSDDAEWAGALERMRADRCASVEDQLGWLREAGLDAECLFRDHRFAVLAAVRRG